MSVSVGQVTGRECRRGRRPTAARSAATVSSAMWSSASAGSVITTIRSASTDSGSAPIEMWMVGTPWARSARMRSTPACVSYQPPSERHVDEARAARVGHLEPVGGELERVAGERGAAAGADAGHLAQSRGAVAEQFGAVAEQRDREPAAERAQALVEDPGDRTERVLEGSH